jgi:hypothetical protein
MSVRDDSPSWNKVPRAELAELDSMLAREKREFRFIKWLDGGYSGSPIALIQDKPSGRASMERILKFCSRGQSEVLGIDAAYELAPEEFKSRHLVKKLRGFQLSHWYCMLMEIAGGDLSSSSLAEYATDEQLVGMCSDLVESLLTEWNKGERELSEVLRTGEFLLRVTGPHKIETDGSLANFASRSGISRDDQWIRRVGWNDWLRNPLNMLLEDFGVELSAVVGIGHGDLSVFNVLIPGLPNLQPFAYWLIDYGTSSPSHPLTRDPMYLLLSLATQWLQEMRIPSRMSQSLIKLLAFSQDSVKSISMIPYQRVCNEIVKTGHEWAKLKGRGHHWIPQSQLSIIGCALAFIGREIGSLAVTETDDWLFDLAAVAATEYCKTYERESVPPPPGPLSLDLKEVDPLVGSGSIQELIEELNSATFSQEHWTQLELGTRNLRAVLSESSGINSDTGTRVSGLVTELRRVLDNAISPLASPTQLSTACRRAEDLRERLMTLLRS